MLIIEPKGLGSYVFWDGKEGTACLTGRSGAGDWCWLCCPQGGTLDKPLSFSPILPPWPEFLHLYIDGFLLSTCCVLGTEVVCEQDRS